MKKLIGTIGLGLILSWSSGLFAVDDGLRDPLELREPKELRMEKLFFYLDLTPEQEEKVAEIRKASKTAIRDYKTQAGIDRQQLKEQRATIVQSKDFDEQAFRKYLADKQVHQNEIAVIRAQMRHTIWHTLTVEQQQKLEMLQEKYAKRKKGYRR